MALRSVAVLGLGKVGLLAARLLDDLGYEVTGHDLRAPAEEVPFDVRPTDVSDVDALRRDIAGADAVEAGPQRVGVGDVGQADVEGDALGGCPLVVAGHDEAELVEEPGGEQPDLAEPEHRHRVEAAHPPTSKLMPCARGRSRDQFTVAVWRRM